MVRRWTAVGTAMLLMACLGVVASPATAATSSDYASWSFTGSSTAYSGAVGMAVGFPAVSITSDSRTPPSPPVASGATVWLPEGTPFADRFGSSQGQPYINLRPRADNPTSPSSTTYTFATPTPVGTWGINLGDIDAEILTITATSVGGAPVSAADLGLEGAYNYCDASPRSSSCSGQVAPYAVPSVTQTAAAVTLEDTQCPATSARCDTQGEAAWFVPRVALTSLTVTSTWKQGFPSYQTWFATQRGTINGTVTSPCTLSSIPTVQLLDDSETELASTPTNDGTYSFTAVARGLTYTARVDPASLPPNATAAVQTVGPVGAVTAAPALTLAWRWTLTGTLEGDDVADVDVALRPEAGGATVHTRTASDGTYRFTDVPHGTFLVTPTPRAGHDLAPEQARVEVSCSDEVAPDFAVTPIPTPSPSISPTSSPTASPSGSPTSTASPAPEGSGAPTTPGVGGGPGDGDGPTPPTAIATTGASAGPVLLAAVTAAATGALLLALRRRRRTDSPG